MKTTHQLAQELLALPDVPVVIEIWTGGGDPVAIMTEYDPDGTAIITWESTPVPVKSWDQPKHGRI